MNNLNLIILTTTILNSYDLPSYFHLINFVAIRSPRVSKKFGVSDDCISILSLNLFRQTIGLEQDWKRSSIIGHKRFHGNLSIVWNGHVTRIKTNYDVATSLNLDELFITDTISDYKLHMQRKPVASSSSLILKIVIFLKSITNCLVHIASQFDRNFWLRPLTVITTEWKWNRR